MISVLEEPTFRSRAVPLSVDAYHHLLELGLVDKKTELICGVIVEKMSKSPLRAFLTNRFATLLQAARPVGHCLRVESPLTFGTSEPEPDLAVVSGRLEDYLAGHPQTALLVVEVAISSEKTDREMARFYAEANVAEFWIVLGSKQLVEVYSSPHKGSYRDRKSFPKSAVLKSNVLANWECQLSSVFP